MTKPAIEQEVAVDRVDYEMGTVVFYATTDAVAEFREFGGIYVWSSIANLYSLHVDKRYDFDKVLEYIQNYGGEE